MDRSEDNAPGHALFLVWWYQPPTTWKYTSSFLITFIFFLVTTYFPGTNMGCSSSCIVNILMDVMDI